MQATLNPTQMQDVREALNDPSSDALIDLIFALNLSIPFGPGASKAVGTAVRLGWVTEHPKLQLTPTGWLIADPLREYRLWLDRDRRIHGELEHELLVPERYASKRVLEVGSGFGCNLLSLSRRVQGDFIGVEPMAIYRQFTSLLAERENVEVPEVLAGAGESLPFEDEEFDIVLCYSAHQYMEIRTALEEMARVLVPGGQLQIIGGTLGAYGEGSVRQLMTHRSPSRMLSLARTTINTLGYQWLGRRLWQPASEFSTVAPIYPTQRAMRSWLSLTGLQVRDDLIRRVGEETCFVADKPVVAQ